MDKFYANSLTEKRKTTLSGVWTVLLVAGFALVAGQKRPENQKFRGPTGLRNF
jgi:hypothetical protein